MTNRIRWDRSQDGFCDSKELRFSISARFSGCTMPQWYEIVDHVNKDTYTAETQKACKEWAERRVQREAD